MIHNFDVIFLQEFCNTTCLIGKCVILMENSIVDYLRMFSVDEHQQLLKACCVIFTVNPLLGRKDVLINHPPVVERHHQLDLPQQFLLPNVLIFSLTFSQPCLTFTFEFGSRSGESMIQ